MAYDLQAFEMTWESTCNAETDNAELIVPKGKTFLMHTLVFDGPCNPTKISFSVRNQLSGFCLL